MSAVASAEVIQELLKGLDSEKRARELFAELNYSPVNHRLPLPTTATDDALAEDPRIIAEHGGFKIIFSRMKEEDRLRRGVERQVIDKLLKDYYPYSLYLFADRGSSQWDFVNVKNEQPRRVHRRIAIGPDERLHNRLRTPSERLEMTALANDQLDRLEYSPLDIQLKHDGAFDVEQVTKKFYQEYRRVFEAVEQQITSIDAADDRRLFTQRLFNRLMFIAFIQKKGWLKLDGSTDYLNKLWTLWKRSGDEGSFYNSRLKTLFFVALDNPAGHNYMQGDKVARQLRDVLGDVPYLNGGLFERRYEDKSDAIDVPDAAIEQILDDLFNSFNFTVTESTPLDVEVAVDPEMLGKVFEELVTGRHESGSYYTPKPIVSFMCREALKTHLATAMSTESHNAIEKLVDSYNADDIRDPEGVLSSLQSVTACDPACGSGAYLLGMLHELVEVRNCLFTAHKVDHVAVYNRKLEIIQNNLYGVDIDPFATNISRLRLWLSLAVDFEGDEPEPLPNLGFKIHTGDSLLGPGGAPPQQLGLRNDQVSQYQQLKAEYMSAHGDNKRLLREEIKRQRDQLAIWTHGGKSTRNGFDWPVEFAEVFADGGFDIVLANPPYVRQEELKRQGVKPDLKRVYGQLYSGTADLYVFFYYRALEILKSGGALAFISSNKWFRANYGKKLRQHVADTCQILSITDFRDLPVFAAATAYPMIFIAQRGTSPGGKTRYTEVESLKFPYPDIDAVIRRDGQVLPAGAISGDRWQLVDNETATLILTMETGTVPLGEYVNGQIYRGVLTGFNKAFVIDGAKRAELIAADPRSAEIIKPLAVGRDIRRWHVRDSDRWLIFTRHGIEIDQYPAIKEYLSQWRRELTPKSPSDPSEKMGRKPGSYKWYEIQDNVAYYPEFDKPKITCPDMASAPRFAYDPDRCFALNTSYIIPVDDLYLLAVLNSRAVHAWFLAVSSQIRGGYLRFIYQYMVDIPVPLANHDDHRELARLSSEAIRLSNQEELLMSMESEINDRVASLYGIESAVLEVGGE